jgi:hypothetical protein
MQAVLLLRPAMGLEGLGLFEQLSHCQFSRPGLSPSSTIDMVVAEHTGWGSHFVDCAAIMLCMKAWIM